MNATRITVADGLCARSVGAGDVAAALRHAVPAGVDVVRVGCDGTCWAQPVVTVRAADGSVRRFDRFAPEDAVSILSGTGASSTVDPFAGQTRRVLARCGVLDPESIDDARRRGAYTALGRAQALPPEEVTALVKAAGNRGRGGAYFPIAVKWESARAYPEPRYLVVNAEEGEPGAYKDRHLMEGDPHLLLEGTAIAAHAAGCARVFLYINGHARLSAELIARATADAAAAGPVGPAPPLAS